ncbi:glycosyltransferase family 2 protein [Thermodesulfobacteriota bacterium]
MSLSVIIPVFNGEKTLKKCLVSVFRSEDVDFEVVVVDDASSDRSAGIAREFSCRLILSEQNRGAAASRNAGAREASGDVLVFLDADMYVFPDTLKMIEGIFEEDPAVRIVGGTCAPEAPSNGWGPTLFALQYYYTLKWGDGEERKTTSALPSDLAAIDREVFNGSGGFDESFKGAGVEEYELGSRLSAEYPIWLYRKVRAVHDFPPVLMRARKLFRRSITYVPFFLNKRSFEAAGQMPNRENALLSVSAFGVCAGAALSLVFPLTGLFLVLGFALLYSLNIRSLLRFIHREKGGGFTVFSFFILFYLYLVVGLGFSTGLVKVGLERLKATGKQA